MKTIEVTLEKKARKSGGDKYVSADGRFTIYIPQEISRNSGKVQEVFKVHFEALNLSKEV